MKQTKKKPAPRKVPLPPHAQVKKATIAPASNARLAEFVFKDILEGGERGPHPYNPKWRSLEEQSYLILASLRLLRSYMEASYQRGLNNEAVSDCLALLEPVINFFDSVDLTGLVMGKERELRAGGGKGKAA